MTTTDRNQLASLLAHDTEFTLTAVTPPVTAPPVDPTDDGGSPPDLETILANLARAEVPQPKVDLVVAAYRLAYRAHAGQTRKSGEPYILHPLAVARLISDYIPEPDMIASALMHDVLEDTAVSFEEMATQFGPEISRMVEGVTKLNKFQFNSAAERQAESTRKMFYAIGQDIRVLLIKLADRLHNMRTLEHLKPEKQQAIAQDTLDLYAPLAHRLGMYLLKSELEDLAFKYLHPEEYRSLAEQVNLKKEERERIITEAVSAMKSLLTQKNIPCSVKGRAKHLYSIWRKMERDDLEFGQLYDLFALRVVIHSNDEGDCYRVLGLVHSVWQPIYEKLKDYIGRPKSNGYQSLHTVVIGPEGRPLEIQIRTKAMDERAEMGIAAHFLYKEERKGFSELDEKLSWLRNILDWQSDDSVQGQQFMDGLKTDLITEEVLVFTPKGDVISLPAGSTPVDFAYHIHTDVGHSTRGALVNGHMKPLSTKLQNGDIVEMITRKGAKAPARDWLNFVASNRAASKIRAYYKRLDHDVNVSSGREDLEAAERKAGLAHLKLIAEVNLRKLCPEFEIKTLNSLYAAIGRGDISAKQVVNRLRQRLVEELKAKGSVGRSAPLADRVPLEGTAGTFGLDIEGGNDITVHVAKCCLPIHGDEVVGYVTKGRGIAIHRADCKGVHSRSLEEGRRIEAAWSEKPNGVYLAAIDLWVLDRVGLLSEVTQQVAAVGVNVSGVKVTLAKDKTARIRIRVQVRSIKELQKTIAHLEKIQDVLEVKRASGM